MSWGIHEQIAHLKKLLTPGLIGTYHSFEVTEVIGFQPDGTATNLLSLLVAEPGHPPADSKLDFLTPNRIPLPKTKWKIGVSRFRIKPQRLIDALQNLSATGEWKLVQAPLKVGALTPVPPQFVPSDSFRPHPWNGILKNNFFDGSHVLELFDREKVETRFILDEPRVLTELGRLVRLYAPIGIDGLSDRMGNVLIQMPVTLLVTRFGGHEEGTFPLEPAWHPGYATRPLRISWEIFEDATIEDFTSRAIQGAPAKFPLHSKRMGARYIVWDDVNDVIVAASAQTAFFGGNVSVTSHTMSSANREFLRPTAADSAPEPATVLLREKAKSPHGSHPNLREPWRSRRLFRESLHALQMRKEFVQYGGLSGAGRDQALADVRWLLAQHGSGGAWLWDPYLDAKDVLSTLFYCPWQDADLRALSAGKTASEDEQEHGKAKLAPITGWRKWKWLTRLLSVIGRTSVKSKGPPAATAWKARQCDLLKDLKGNGKGLRLEFRVRSGSAGWPFHDRFLIFPTAPEGVIAWSLGTSVNALGGKHHILQKVSDGELIRQSFLELWDALDAPDYQVWKTP
jgi:hypothetical protein